MGDFKSGEKRKHETKKKMKWNSQSLVLKIKPIRYKYTKQFKIGAECKKVFAYANYIVNAE